MATLSMAVSVDATTVNLTTVGVVDWADWTGAQAAADFKSGGGHTIPDPTLVTGGGFNSYSNDPRTISWTDGTNTASSSNTSGTYNNGVVGTGLQLALTADTNTRVMYLYPAVFNMTTAATVTASLSDGSSSTVTDTTTLTGGVNALVDGVIQLTYAAASAGQTLTVSWTSNTVGGTINLQAAALQSAGIPPGPPQISVLLYSRRYVPFSP